MFKLRTRFYLLGSSSVAFIVGVVVVVQPPLPAAAALVVEADMAQKVRPTGRRVPDPWVTSVLGLTP